MNDNDGEDKDGNGDHDESGRKEQPLYSDDNDYDLYDGNDDEDDDDDDDIYIMMKCVYVCLSRFCLFCLPPAKLTIYI